MTGDGGGTETGRRRERGREELIRADCLIISGRRGGGGGETAQFISSSATTVSAPLPPPAADQWIDYRLDMRCWGGDLGCSPAFFPQSRRQVQRNVCSLLGML